MPGRSPAPIPRPMPLTGTGLKTETQPRGFRIGASIKRKEVTMLTREMAALLEAGIPILQALNGLGEEEENPALKQTLGSICDSVRKGASLSSALEEYPKLFNKLYTSMVKVGEEAGVLQGVMTDLADLLEHEDEVRGEVVAAVSYPVFVLAFGVFTATVLMTVVLPRPFSMLQEMLQTLPLPTLILLRLSGALNHDWPVFLIVIGGGVAGARHALKTPEGARRWDGLKLKLPVMGAVFRAAALSRFARTLGTLVKSGVSLLPALKIVEITIGNLILTQLIARVAEETRGGDSLAAPLRKLGLFPKNAVQMIRVGEETGRLDETLLNGFRLFLHGRRRGTIPLAGSAKDKAQNQRAAKARSHPPHRLAMAASDPPKDLKAEKLKVEKPTPKGGAGPASGKSSATTHSVSAGLAPAKTNH